MFTRSIRKIDLKAEAAFGVNRTTKTEIIQIVHDFARTNIGEAAGESGLEEESEPRPGKPAMKTIGIRGKLRL